MCCFIRISSNTAAREFYMWFTNLFIDPKVDALFHSSHLIMSHVYQNIMETATRKVAKCCHTSTRV